MIYSRNVRKKFTIFRGISTNNVPELLNIEIFPESFMNILQVLHPVF